MKRALLVAFHFPPIRHSSGIQRALANARYLPEHGWQPIILTANARAYPSLGDDQLADVPVGTAVHRAFAMDAKRQLSVAGRYLGVTANPDRYATWIPAAVAYGMRLIRAHRPAVLWSTYPIASALVIGRWLARLSGLPWVADLRDSLYDDQYPTGGVTRRRHVALEAATVATATRIVVTSPGTAALYRQRYPDLGERLVIIPNGYDDEIFNGLAELTAAKPAGGRPLVLLHAGLLYPVERDPRSFFEALAVLRRRGVIDADRLRVRLRATGYDDQYRPLLESLGIADIVELLPAVGYRQALAEMLGADGLLIFQSAGCNHQTPAKLYEYFRAGRPILALTDAAGDTAATMRQAGLDAIVPLDNAGAIADGLLAFVESLEAGAGRLPNAEVMPGFSRRRGVARLATLFDQVSDPG